MSEPKAPRSGVISPFPGDAPRLANSSPNWRTQSRNFCHSPQFSIRCMRRILIHVVSEHSEVGWRQEDRWDVLSISASAARSKSLHSTPCFTHDFCTSNLSGGSVQFSGCPSFTRISLLVLVFKLVWVFVRKQTR